MHSRIRWRRMSNYCSTFKLIQKFSMIYMSTGNSSTPYSCGLLRNKTRALPPTPGEYMGTRRASSTRDYRRGPEPYRSAYRDRDRGLDRDRDRGYSSRYDDRDRDRDRERYDRPSDRDRGYDQGAYDRDRERDPYTRDDWRDRRSPPPARSNAGGRYSPDRRRRSYSASPPRPSSPPRPPARDYPAAANSDRRW